MIFSNFRKVDFWRFWKNYLRNKSGVLGCQKRVILDPFFNKNLRNLRNKHWEILSKIVEKSKNVEFWPKKTPHFQAQIISVHLIFGDFTPQNPPKNFGYYIDILIHSDFLQFFMKIFCEILAWFLEVKNLGKKCAPPPPPSGPYRPSEKNRHFFFFENQLFFRKSRKKKMQKIAIFFFGIFFFLVDLFVHP